MSAPVTVATKKATYQPFECSVCHSRFTRHENLKRHAALHSTSPEDTSVPCGLCPSTFSRPDLRRRHMKRKHPGAEKTRPSRAFSHDSESSAAASSKRFRPDDNIQDDQNVALTNLFTGGSANQSDPVSVDDEHFDQADHQSLQLHTIRTNDSVSVASTGGRSGSVSDNFPDRTWMQQPWLTDLRYIDHFVEGASQVEARRAHNAAAASHHEFAGPIPSGMITTMPANNISPTSNMLSPPTSDITGSPSGPSPNTLRFRDDWFPSPDQTTRGFELYFHHISQFLPFIHAPTFDETTVPPVLILSMLSLAYQYGEDPANEKDPSSGRSLALHCFHRARILLYLEEEHIEDPPYNLSLVQAYLLIEICAIMYLCGNDSSYGIQAHPRMIALARAGGVLQPRTVATGTTQDLDSLWRQFVETESRKRTAYAIHQFDAMLYQFLSIPRSLSHLEIKHDLPCPIENWSAASAAEWAHRQLIAGSSSASISYVEAVRLFLSPQPKLDTLPIFDPYGAINIAQFLISSAREISGWSVMTGRVSMERLEPLRSSLEALRPFIRTQVQTSTAKSSRLMSTSSSEATLEIAMIELQMWSPSHTGGIVCGNIETVLKEWTSMCLGPWSETLFNASKAIQPHVDWYLEYLDSTAEVDSEPPWIALYAFKAYLIAWQLLRGGMKGAMQVVGVQDESREGAIAWAKDVFERRKRWEIGKLILKSIDTLAEMDGVG